MQKKIVLGSHVGGTTREEMGEKQLVEDLAILEDPTELKSSSDIHHISESWTHYSDLITPR
mgnify:CR=1 FL=1